MRPCLVYIIDRSKQPRCMLWQTGPETTKNAGIVAASRIANILVPDILIPQDDISGTC